MPSPTAVSAPGKVLLAGGYLVLDRAYTALVFGLSARIHVLVEDIETEEGLQLEQIVVQSPQFLEAVWDYGYRLVREGGGVEVTQLQGSSTTDSRNPFVETTLIYTLTYISSFLPKGTTITPSKITILADPDYYSHTPSNPSARYSSFNVRLADAHKTGLGSSAALVTALTASLLTHYLPPTSFSLSSERGRSILHNLSQASHCTAQGKVGSGFDIAAAVHGTLLYRRFSPSILSSKSLPAPRTPGFSSALKRLIEDNDDDEQKKKKIWDIEILAQAVIPRGMALVMCDVDCGSQTVGMVKQVLQWRNTNATESQILWDELQKCNESLAKLLAAGDNPDIPELRKAFEEIRKRIREMGEKSGVPIEPKEQTELLDGLTEGVDGVVGGVVPGAGGYDAIVLLIRDDKKTMDELEAFLKKWKADRKGNVRLLGARGELEGARVEEWKAYEGAMG